MPDVSMTGALLTVFGSIASGGIMGALSAQFQARRELEIWERSRHSMVTETAAALLRDTVTSIAAAGHAACWLTWKAEHDPESLAIEDIQRYDETMRDLLPKILGGQAAIGTLCPETARKVMEAVDIISEERVEVSRGCVAYRKGDAAPLAKRHIEARKSYEGARGLCAGLAAQLLAGKHMRAGQGPYRKE